MELEILQDGRFPFPASDSFHSFNINLVKDKGLPRFLHLKT